MHVGLVVGHDTRLKEGHFAVAPAHSFDKPAFTPLTLMRDMAHRLSELV